LCHGCLTPEEAVYRLVAVLISLGTLLSALTIPAWLLLAG
jgi:hypothetical protein